MNEQTDQEASYPEDHAMEYLQPIRGDHQSVSNSSQPLWKDDDDDSRCFMSEPSLSEEEGNPQPSSIGLPLLSPQDSLSEGADDPPSPPRPPLQQPSPHTVLSSPGNTSLSSRDSPHLHKRIQLQFGAENKRARLKMEPSPQGSMLIARPIPQKPIQDHQMKDDDTKKSSQALSSRSTSSVSIGQQLRAANFLEDLKIQSIGAVQDAASNDFDSDRRNQAQTDKKEINTVIRTKELNQEPENDETLVMVLSDSEGEGTMKSDEEPLDWEQQHSADDEQTLEQRPRRRRIFSAESKHRRTRSGDGVAANMLTGSLDWKGMQEDRLPVPPNPDREEEEDDGDGDCDDDALLRSERGDSVPQLLPNGPADSAVRFCTKSQGTGEHSSEDSSITGFAIGTSTQNNRFMRKKRKTGRPQTLVLNRNDTWNSSASTWGDNKNITPRAGAQGTSKAAGSRGFAVPAAVGFGSSNSVTNESLSTLEAGGVESLYVNHKHSEREPNDGHGAHPLNYVHAVHVDVHARGSDLSHMQNYIGTSHQRTQPKISTDSQGSKGSVFSWLSNEESGTNLLRDAGRENVVVEDVDTDGEKVEEESKSGEPNNVRWYRDESTRSVDTFDAGHIVQNQLNFDPRDAQRSEELFENREYRGSVQNVMRSRISPYFTRPTITPGTLDKRALMKIRASFKPVTNILDENTRRGYPTFVCPQCGTRQREFFTVSSAPSEMQGPAGYLAFYFGMYVIASLYIFGLEEGWDPLDCVYFAVTTLMTAGLGDLVPTTDTAKIICSIFIYFGVACIGLLLGTYLANMLDERSKMQAMKTRVNNCVVCSETGRRLHPRSAKHSPSAPGMSLLSNQRQSLCFSEGQVERKRNEQTNPSVHQSKERRHYKVQTRPDSTSSLNSRRSPYFSDNSSTGSYATQEKDDLAPVHHRGSDSNLSVIDRYGSFSPTEAHVAMSPRATIPLSPRSGALGSPMTSQILGRQSHTRHISLDATNPGGLHYIPHLLRSRIFSEDDPTHHPSTIHETQPAYHQSANQRGAQANWEYDSDEVDIDDELSVSSDSLSEAEEVSIAPNRIKTAKYVFLTLREALMNSIVIIAIGSIGFHYIEEFSLVDSFYFTTVLLTTVGYGDLVPVTSGGKVFATIYLLLAGTVLLNNMSLISMIPLELRKRRIERAVLNQFGDQLDDVALRELATGPLVKRLQLSVRRADGLDECTREMFALAMLVRLGKVTERDIKMTFAAFRKLDVDNEGVLNSRTIITGMMHKKKSMSNLRMLIDDENSRANVHAPPPPPIHDPEDYWTREREILHRASPTTTLRFTGLDASVAREDERAQLLNTRELHVPTLGYYGGTGGQ